MRNKGEVGDYVKIVRPYFGYVINSIDLIITAYEFGYILEINGVYGVDRVEVIPKEVYNTPLFKALQEDK